MSRVKLYAADVVAPVAGPPIDQGAIAVRDGILTDVGTIDAISGRYPDGKIRRWPGVMIPGLVNAHTHLQYTSFQKLGASPHAGFEAWSVAFDLVYAERFRTEDWYESALHGSIMALESGTTTVADICTDHPALTAPRDAGLRAVSYVEVLGDEWGTWARVGRDRFLKGLRKLQDAETDRLKIGISPHAPYSLDTPVLSDLTQFARTEGFRIHTHLAESEFEDAYYRSGIGPLADFVSGFSRGFQVLEQGGTAMSATEFAHSTGLLGKDCHVAHGIYIDAEGRKTLRETSTAVALCPRSNQTIGLGTAPIAAYLEEGNRIAVGTDSLSSSPSLDLLEDVAMLHDMARSQGYTGADLAHRLLAAATMGGARALGLHSHHGGVGSLEVGKAADFAVIDIESTGKDVAESIVTTGAGRCVAAYVAGISRYDAAMATNRQLRRKDRAKPATL